MSADEVTGDAPLAVGVEGRGDGFGGVLFVLESGLENDQHVVAIGSAGGAGQVLGVFEFAPEILHLFTGLWLGRLFGIVEQFTKKPLTANTPLG